MLPEITSLKERFDRIERKLDLIDELTAKLPTKANYLFAFVIAPVATAALVLFVMGLFT